MITPDFNKEPWKHPAVWGKHLVSMTREYRAGADVSVATCECGWTVCVRADRKLRAFDAQDKAVHDHWHSIIAEAKAVAA